MSRCMMGDHDFEQPGDQAMTFQQMTGMRALPTAGQFLWCLAVICSLTLGSITTFGAEGEVVAQQEGDQIAITIDGQPFTTLHLGKDLKKPYFWPLRAADGAILTRPIEPGEKEHPHHKGLWISIDEVNHSKHWMEREPIVNRGATIEKGAGEKVVIRLENEWLNGDGQAQLRETTRWTITANRLIAAEIVLEPLVDDVTMGDTKEGFFAVRIAQTMRELQGGKILTANGKTKTKEAWGQPAQWIDYSGKVNEKTYGVTILDDAANFRPGRYHVRDYGLFTVSPFGEGSYQNDMTLQRPVVLAAKGATQTVKLRYGLWVHSGVPSAEEIQKVYEGFLTEGRPENPKKAG